MTISSTTNRVAYTGNGSTQAFAFGYKFLANADLKVYQNDVLKTITTHYTVTGAGLDGGGTVTFLTAPANGDSVVIVRDPAITQETDLVENDPLPAETLENSLDKLTIICQRLDDRLDRSIVLSDSETGAVTLTLPAASASKALKWNATADGLENSTYDPDTLQAAAAASASAAAISAAAALVSENNAATSESNASTSESNAASSESAAAISAAAAEAAYDDFDDRYLGPKSSDPSLDNDGDALVAGALYFNTVSSVMKVYDGANWIAFKQGWCSVLDFGADPTNSTNSASAFQSAVDAGYAIVFVPAGVYQINTTVNITNQVRIIGCSMDFKMAGGGIVRLRSTSTTNDILTVNADNVTIEGIEFSGAAGRAIDAAQGNGVVVGSVTRSVSDAAMTAASASLTSATAAFTTADVGSYVRIAGAYNGTSSPYITAYVSATEVTVNAAADNTVSGAAATIAPIITGFVMRDSSTSSQSIGVDLKNASNFLLDNCHLQGFYGIRIGQQTSAPDKGDSAISNCHISATTGAGSYAMRYLGSGGLRVTNTKFLDCYDSVSINWAYGISGGPLFSNCSFENFTNSAITATGSFALYGLKVSDCWINGGAKSIFINDALTLTDFNLCGNTFKCGTGSATLVTVGAATTNFNIVGNIFSGSSATGVAVVTGATGGVISSNLYSGCSTTVSAASTAWDSNSVDINAGTIDGTAIGATTASTGAFTSLSSTLSSGLTATISGTTTAANAFSVSASPTNASPIAWSYTGTITASGTTLGAGLYLGGTVACGGASLANYYHILNQPSYNSTVMPTTAANFQTNLSIGASGAGTITSWNGVFVAAPTNAGTTTVTNYHGIRVANTTLTHTLAIAAYLQMASGSGKWNVYASGTANNYFKGNVGINTNVFDASSAGVLAMANATAPSAAITDGIQIYAADTSDSTSTLALYTEQAVESIGTFTPSHKLKVIINGTAYWIQLDAV